MCYGYPFIVAFIYIFIHTSTRGHIYGPATLWCWIDVQWVALRIALCYAPAWAAIITSFCIYLMAGREIFAKRKQLRAFRNRPTDLAPIENPFTDFKTTEVQITREPIVTPGPDMPQNILCTDNGFTPGHSTISPFAEYDQYSISIGPAPTAPRRNIPPTASSKNAMQRRANRATMEANAAAWGYTKVALLFFISLLVTWVSLSLPDCGHSTCTWTRRMT